MVNRRITENEDVPVKTMARTVFYAILTGMGFSIGFYIMKKKLK